MKRTYQPKRNTVSARECQLQTEERFLPAEELREEQDLLTN